MGKDGYIEELYEKYEEEFVRSKNYQTLAEKLEKKYAEMEKKFSEDQLNDVEEFEMYLSSLLEIEVKEAFKNGFYAATNLIKNSPEDES